MKKVLIKAAWYWGNNRQIDWWGRIKNPKQI